LVAFAFTRCYEGYTKAIELNW